MTLKFSKDKFWLEPPSENLKKQLDAELRLSGADLKSHAWYHGPVPWEVCTHTHTHTESFFSVMVNKSSILAPIEGETCLKCSD